MSVEASNVEHMFEGLADADLVDAMTSSAREENAACARRLVAIGVLDARRARELADCNLWRTDPWEEVAAEVSAALNIGRGRASGLIGYARALRDKLPAVAAVFATGAIDFRMMMTIVTRTATVDDEVMGRLDTALARHVPKWMRLSGPKLADRIDLWVAKFDPAGVRVPPKTDEQRYVEIEPTSAGMAGIWANIHAPDAAALDQRLDALAGSVCPAGSAHPGAAPRRCRRGVGRRAGPVGVRLRIAGLPGRERRRAGGGDRHPCAGRAGHRRRRRRRARLSAGVRDRARRVGARPGEVGAAQTADGAERGSGAGLSAVGGVGRVRPVARSDVPVPGL